MKTSRLLAMLSAIVPLQLTAIRANMSENEPGTFKITGTFDGVSFRRQVLGVVNDEPYHAYSGVSGSGVLKNEKDEVIAEGALQAIERLIPKQAYHDGRFRSGAGRRPLARSLPAVVGDGIVALGCSFVMFEPGAG